MNVTCRFRAIVAAGLLWALISAATAQGGGVSNPAAHVETGTYLFSAGQCTLIRTGGRPQRYLPYPLTYSVQGQFQLLVDRDAKTASFAQVDANATYGDPPQWVDLKNVFDLTLLAGTTVDDKTILFTGKASDTSDVRLTVTLQEALVRLVGETTPPPGGMDFHSYSLDAVAQRKYGGGTGEPNDPYQIATAADLIALGNSPQDYDKHFILTADIDLDPNLPGRKIFDMGVISLLTGVFDGAGHTISNFAQVSMNKEYAGLFAYIDGPSAEVKNLGLIAPQVDTQTAWCVGALVGRLDQGTIANCHVRGGNVSGRSYRKSREGEIYEGLSYTGGLIGITRGTVTDCGATCTVFGSSCAGGLAGISIGAVVNCASSGNVSGNIEVGGLLGWNHVDGEVTACSATGNVSTKGASAGGLVGVNTARIINSYATGSVSGSSSVGGLVGCNGRAAARDIPADSGEIINSYSTGAVSGSSYVGGLVGLQEVGPVIASFWNVQTSGQATSGAEVGKTTARMRDGQTPSQTAIGTGVGKTTAQMLTIETFLEAGWDFVGETANGTEDIWWIAEGKDYPRLWWEARN